MKDPFSNLSFKCSYISKENELEDRTKYTTGFGGSLRYLLEITGRVTAVDCVYQPSNNDESFSTFFFYRPSAGFRSWRAFRLFNLNRRFWLRFSSVFFATRGPSYSAKEY